MHKPLIWISTVIAILALGVCIFFGCHSREAARFGSSSLRLVFDLTDVKREIEKSTYSSTLKLRGLVKLRGDAPTSSTIMLLLRRKITFPKSGEVKEGEDAVLIRGGTGLVDISIFLSSKDTEAIALEWQSASITWEPVGFMPLQPATVNVK